MDGWSACVCACVCARTHPCTYVLGHVREGGEEKITAVLNLKPCKNHVKEGVEN